MKILTILIPMYFGPTLHTKGVIWTPSTPPTILSTLIGTNVKYCKVSENKRLVKIFCTVTMATV